MVDIELLKASQFIMNFTKQIKGDKMRYLATSFMCLILLLAVHLKAQDVKALISEDSLSTDYPFLFNVILSAKVSYSSSTGFYYYNYTLTNDSKNKGDLWYFEIDITRSPNSVMYDTIGLRFANYFEEGQFRRYYPPANKLVESIGLPTLPNLNWTADIEHNSVANFAVGLPFVKPQSTVTNLVMMSKALPGIRAITAYPYFNVGEFYPDIDQDTSEVQDSIYNLIYAYVDSMKNVVNYHGWTIGPTAPPLIFSAGSWIDTLISYKHRSFALGWIDTQGIASSLDSKLDNAKTKLAAGDTTAAKNILNAFVNEVEAQNGKHLTSEAYALLKYNAEYLIRRMK